MNKDKDNMPSFNIKMDWMLRIMFAWSDLVDAMIRVVTFGLWQSGLSTWSRYKYTNYIIIKRRKEYEEERRLQQRIQEDLDQKQCYDGDAR
jgi:hypothetical protein